MFGYAYKLYNCWLGFLWQKNELAKCGIPTCIEVNSSSETFYFNDFLESQFSEYDDLEDNQEVEHRAFKRDLTIEEIFISTYFFRDETKTLKLYAEKETAFRRVVMQNDSICIFEGEVGEEGKLIEEIALNVSYPFEFKQESPLKQVANKFKEAINSGWDFRLQKCEVGF